ncbi:LacI family DNA-binding transcriptional regulator [Pediococcus pentosaceus]
MTKKANIKDVANLAGVSIATVSRYLNNDLSRMSEKTAQKVQDAITKLRYTPNLAARQLITKSSKMIAVLISNIDDYFSTELFKGISSILESKGYIAVMFDSNSDADREKKLLKTIGNRMFDGLIIQPINDPHAIQEALGREIPIVVVDRGFHPNPWSQVVADNYQSAQVATKYFLDQGYKHVVVLTSELNSISSRLERYQGIKSLTDNIDIIQIDENTYNQSAIFAQLAEKINNVDEDILFFALKEKWLLEFVPILTMEAQKEHRRVTITGFADTKIVAQLDPELHLVTQQPFLMGASSAELMIQILTDKNDIPHEVIIESNFK